MDYNTVTMQRLTRLRLSDCFAGYTIIAPISGVCALFTGMSIAPFAGVRHGSTVSISRGSPPHKKR